VISPNFEAGKTEIKPSRFENYLEQFGIKTDNEIPKVF
jgi:hypothetical protein